LYDAYIECKTTYETYLDTTRLDKTKEKLIQKESTAQKRKDLDNKMEETRKAMRYTMRTRTQ